jgi:hypothetical protein
MVSTKALFNKTQGTPFDKLRAAEVTRRGFIKIRNYFLCKLCVLSVELASAFTGTVVPP